MEIPTPVHRPRGRLRVGLTGGVASGKSTVAELLSGHGAEVIDADLLARQVVAQGTEGLAAVVACFGDGVLTPAGELDRPALGRIVFADPAARARLEAIIHPLVRQRAAQLEAEATGQVVVQMIPLLVETGQQDRFDLVVVVDLPPAEQERRLLARDHLTPAEARARIAAQASRGERLRWAQIIVDNSGELAGLPRLIDQLWSVLQRRASLLAAGNV